jgi:tetratricopeptide (TPR) repeat protein
MQRYLGAARRVALAVVVAQVGTVAWAHEFTPLIKAKKFAEAERAIAAKLAADPNQVDALVAKTDLILSEGKDGRLDEAAKVAEQCIAANPKRSECHEALGNVLGTKAQKGGIMSAMGYVGKIRDSFKEAVALDANNQSARFALMQFYLQAPGVVGGGTGKVKDLITETAKTSSSAAALMQAFLDMQEDRLDRAIKGALAVDTTGQDVLARQQRNVLSNIAQYWVGEKKFAEADRVFHELVQRFPESSIGYYGQGRVLQEQGKPKEALVLLEKASSLDISAITLYRIAKAHQELGNKSEALKSYEKALAMRPELSKKLKTDAEEQMRVLKG